MARVRTRADRRDVWMSFDRRGLNPGTSEGPRSLHRT